MSSVFDDVKLVAEYAQKESILHANPIEGDRTLYDADSAKQKFSNKSDWLGVAGNLLWCNLLAWAISEQSVSKTEAADYGKTHFRGSQPPKMTLPVGIAVIGGTSPGQKGTWRRISLDLQTYGFLCEWAAVLRQEPRGQAELDRLKQFEDAARHCPMDFYYFEAGPEVEKQIFKKSFSIMEDLRKKEEQHAPGGWAVCRLFHRAHVMQRAARSQDNKQGSEVDVVEFFEGFDFAQTSEYRNLDKKLAKGALLLSV